MDDFVEHDNAELKDLQEKVDFFCLLVDEVFKNMYFGRQTYVN